MSSNDPELTPDLLRRMIESNDAAGLARSYTSDAVLRVIDRLNPPNRPRDYEGGAAIAEYYADICGRAVTHRVTDALRADDRLAFSETCQYPDGRKVICTAMVELSGGRIRRQVNLQVWDE